MLTVWGRNNSINVQKVMWTVAELGLEHQRHDVGRQFGGLDTVEFRAMNPNGLIPTIDDDGTIVWESNAVVRYLAAKYGAGSLWPEDVAARAAADRWMDWMLGAIIPPMAPVFVGLIRTPPEDRDGAAIAAGAELMTGNWRILDEHLAATPYVAGADLTMADIPLGCACYRYYALDIPHPDMPHLMAWYERLQAREAYREHVMIELS
ncbi:MAG: glutathione S-transferase family protein [Rhodospirillaceae bacterium]|jgi:glutathione S-transferase|nr:glutathione S-transferase family protein [Rhodospirillaceae bacterium]MBT3627404.1 glutathione S-transferase family protein [Rhodospirillaceae bacterium]MBT3928618.1 glutathione S-transferase family protein [Rhodospirillaceae bacterium]MBT4426441.1 glutathione S-transferase family protein [Rhodospirillaceae bacterium]MBT5037820.1 glutathione S-transferase family protein [Rhodospirillaceae bacterium]